MSLKAAAAAVRENAHAPYSGFKVGAALRAGSGAVYAGCNVENVSYPEGTCAEAGAIAAMVAAGELGDIRVVHAEYPQDWLTEALEDSGQKQASWRTDPSGASERSTRMPSTFAARSAPPSRPVMVAVSSAAGEKAEGPSTALRRAVAVPWPPGLKVHPLRPRPTSTQPPPSVVMSQWNGVGRSNVAFQSQ